MKSKTFCAFNECIKKQSIIGKCKCNNIYCVKHRLPESHICMFLQEFKKTNKELLKMTLLNQATMSNKIIKI